MQFSSIANQILFGNYTIILWLLLLWLYNSTVRVPQPNFIEGIKRPDYKSNYSILLVFLTMGPLIIWTGTRPDVEDTSNYRWYFNDLNISLEGFKSIFESTGNEGKGKGFTVIEFIIKAIIGNNDILFFTIMAAIMLLLISYVYRRTSSLYTMSVFLLFISTDVYQWGFNGMRQGLAAAIVFVASLYLFDRKYIKFFVLLFIAFTIHSSALIFAVALFVFNGKPWSKKVIVILLFVVIFLFSLEYFTDIIDNVLADTTYSNVVQQFNKDDGVSILRVLVYSVPVIIALIFRHRIEEESNYLIDFAINMSLLGTVFYVIGIFTSGIYIGRIPIYFTLWNYVLLPWELEHIFHNKAVKVLIEIFMIIFYFVFNYYQMDVFMKYYR